MLLVLIVAIAAFNIVSAQTMLVNEKRSDIAILRTMGASEGLVLRLVLVQGILVALARHRLRPVAWSVPRQSRDRDRIAAGVADRREVARRLVFRQVPSVVLASDIALIAAVSFAFCVVSALHPARRAAALNPAEALHEAS